MGGQSKSKSGSPLVVVNGFSATKAMKTKLTTIKNEIVTLEKMVLGTFGAQPLEERSAMKGVLNEIRAIHSDMERELEEQIKKIAQLKSHTSNRSNLKRLEDTIQGIIQKNYKKIELETEKLKSMVKKDSETIKKIEVFERAVAQQQSQKIELSTGLTNNLRDNNAESAKKVSPIVPPIHQQQKQAEEKPEEPKSSTQQTVILETVAGPSSQIDSNADKNIAISPATSTRDVASMTEEMQPEVEVNIQDNATLSTMNAPKPSDTELHIMSKQLETARKQLFDLAGDIEYFREDVAQRDDHIASLIAEKGDLEVKIQGLATESEGYLEAKTAAEDQLKTKETVLEIARASASQREDALSKAQDSLKNLETVLRAEQVKFEKYKAAQEEEGSRKQRIYQASVDDANAQVAAKQNELGQVRVNAQALLDEIKQLTTNLNDIKVSKAVESEQRIETLLSENRALHERVLALEEQQLDKEENKPQALSAPSMEDQERAASLTERVRFLEGENQDLQAIQNQLQTNLIGLVQAGAEELLRTTYPQLLDQISALKNQVEGQQAENTHLINKIKQDETSYQSLIEDSEQDSKRVYEEIAQLTNQASQQRKQFEEIQKNVEKFSAEKDSLEQENQGLKQDKQALDTKLAEAISDVSLLKARVEILSGQADAAVQDSAESKRLTENKWAKERNALTEELLSVRGELEQSENGYSDLVQDYKELQEFYQGLKDELKNTHDELQKVVNEQSYLEDELREKNIRLSDLERQLHETKKTATGKDDQISTLTAESAELSEKVSVLGNEKEGLQSQLKENQSKVEQLDVQIKDLEKTLSTTQKALATSEKRVSEFSEEKTKLERQLVQAKQELSTQENQQQGQVEIVEKILKETQEKKVVLEQQIEEQADKIHQLGEAFRAGEDKLLGLKEEYQVERAVFQREVEALSSENAVLKSRLEQNQSNSTSLAEEADSHIKELDSEVQQRNRRIKELENKLEQIQGNLSREQEANRGIEEQLKTIEGEKLKLTAELTQAKKTLSAQNDNIEILRKQEQVTDNKDKNKPLVNNVVDSEMLLELNETKKQNEALQSERDNLKRKLSHLENDLRDMSSAHQAEEEVVKKKPLSFADELAFEENQRELQSVKSEVEQLKGRISGLQAKLEQVDHAKVTAEKKLSALEGNIFEKEDQVESLTELNVTLKQRIETLQTSLGQAQEDVDQAKISAIGQKRQLQEAKEAFEQANDAKVKAEAEVKTKEQALQQAQTAVQAYQSESVALGQQTQGLQNDLQQMQVKAETLTRALTQANKDKVEVEADVKAKKESLQQAKSQVEQAQEAFKASQEALQQEKANVSEQKRQLNQLYQAKVTAEKQLGEKANQVVSLTTEKAELTKRILALGDEKTALEDHLEERDEQVASLVNQTDQLESEHQAQVQKSLEAQEIIKGLNDQVTQIEKEKDEANSKLDVMEVDKQHLQQENSKLSAELDTVQKKLEQSALDKLPAEPQLSPVKTNPERIRKRRHATSESDQVLAEGENLAQQQERPFKMKRLSLADSFKKHERRDGSETMEGRRRAILGGKPIVMQDLKEKVSEDDITSQISSEDTASASLSRQNTNGSREDGGVDLSSANDAAETSAVVVTPEIEKEQKIDEILLQLTPEVVAKKLNEIASANFLKALSETEEGNTQDDAAIANALSVLSEQVTSLSNQHLATYKKLLADQLNKVPLNELELENDQAMDELLAIESNATALTGMAIEQAETQAKNYLNRFQTAAIAKTRSAFTEAAQAIIDNRSGTPSLAIEAETLAKKTLQNPATEPLVSKLIDHVAEVHKANASDEQQAQARSQINEIFVVNKEEIQSAVEQTLTELEANEKDKLQKQVLIDQLFEKIDSAQVSKALVNYAKPILVNRLAEEGYLLNRLTDKQLEQKLYDLKPSALDAVKEALAATLIKDRTIEQINALGKNPDQLIDRLIHTQINQSSLAKQAEDVAIDLAQQEMDSYDNKTAQDLESYYQSTLDFIQNGTNRLHFAMRDATSRELRDFAREDRASLDSIVTLITNGKLAGKKQELQAKLNDAELVPKDKKSYEQVIKSIEGICQEEGNIKTRIGVLTTVETSLNAIIIQNDQASKQTIVKVESPSHFFKVISKPEELVSTRQDFFNRISPKTNTLPYATVKDYGPTHTVTEFETGSTLLEAIRVQKPNRLFKNKGEITLTYKAVKKDHLIEFSADSVNADTRPSFIKKNIKNIEFLKSSTQSMLELAQGTGEGVENKGFGMLILNTNDKNWKTRYALINAHAALFPKQRMPLILLEGKYTNASLISEKSLKSKLQKLEAKFIKEYKAQAESDKHIDSFNIQANLFSRTP